MLVSEFFDLLLKELEENPSLRGYYRFLNEPSKAKFIFRKRYYIQRLEYIANSVTKEKSMIWDCGCGYGTTAIFLALNGHTVYGNTLEYYFEQIPQRLKYWSRFGDLSQLKLDYKNHFDIKEKAQYDYVIAQDTLHHLEPVNEALDIISESLKSGGELIAIEENGKNIFNRTKNYLRRGNKRILEIYDERLQRNILIGDENTRPLNEWNDLLSASKIYIDNNSVEYVRLYLPISYKFSSEEALDKKEKEIWKKNAFLKKYFYFGTNFIAIKK
jgi:SAM-dependent methyltransferase